MKTVVFALVALSLLAGAAAPASAFDARIFSEQEIFSLP
jgi:hypothetical protein